MDENTGLGPPSYAEAIQLAARESPTPSAPELQLEPDSVPAASSHPDQQEGASQLQTYISDSPHSSDDEETAILKKELRRIREEKINRENERKKLLLRQLLDQERQALRISTERADVSTRSGQFSLNIENASGAIFHPVTTNVPEHPLTGRSNVHNYREQVPRHSEPTPPRSQNTRARVHFATETQFADARQTDVQPSHIEQRTYLSELEPSHVNNNSYTSWSPLTDARQTDVQPSRLQLSEPEPSDQSPPEKDIVHRIGTVICNWGPKTFSVLVISAVVLLPLLATVGVI